MSSSGPLRLPYSETRHGYELTVTKIDRRLDPHLGSVIKDGVLLDSGLFATPARALSWCRETVARKPR